MTQGNELLPKQHHRPTQQRNHHYRTRSSNNSRPTSAGSTTSIRNGYDKNDGSKQRQTTQSRYRSNHHQQKKEVHCLIYQDQRNVNNIGRLLKHVVVVHPLILFIIMLLRHHLRIRSRTIVNLNQSIRKEIVLLWLCEFGH